MLPQATAALHALALVALGGRHRLRRPGRPGPKRHEAADRLFQRQPPGLLHVGRLRRQPPGPCRAACCRWSTTGWRPAGCSPWSGMLYERYHTRRDRRPRRAGPADAPCWPSSMVFLALASIGLPGLNGFVGEFLRAPGDVPARLGRGAAGPGRPVSRDQRRWPSPASSWGRGTCSGWCGGYSSGRCASRPATAPTSRCGDLGLREVFALAPLAGVDRLDRRAAGILSRPHGPDARPPRRCREKRGPPLPLGEGRGEGNC